MNIGLCLFMMHIDTSTNVAAVEEAQPDLAGRTSQT